MKTTPFQSSAFLIRGLFAVLIQLTFIFFTVLSAPLPLRIVYVPYLEYPLMSITLLLGGSLLFEYIQKK